MRDYRDLVIADQANELERLASDNRTLVDLVADMAFDTFTLKYAFKREYHARLHAERALRVAHERLSDARSRVTGKAA